MAEETAPTRPPPPMPSLTRTLMIMSVFFAIFILFDEGLRRALGSAAGVVMSPAFGFGGAYPLLTFLAAGSLTTVISSVARHFLTDWVKQARINLHMRALQKARLEAMRRGQTKKLEGLKKVHLEMQKETSSLMLSQYKPLGYTLLPFSIFYAWLYEYITTDIIGYGHVYFAVPWSAQASFLVSYLFPAWLLLYIVLGIPIGQLVTRSLKLFTFQKRLAALEAQGGAG